MLAGKVELNQQHLTPIHNSLNFKSQSLDFLSKNPDFSCGTDVNTGTLIT